MYQIPAQGRSVRSPNVHILLMRQMALRKLAQGRSVRSPNVHWTFAPFGVRELTLKTLPRRQAPYSKPQNLKPSPTPNLPSQFFPLRILHFIKESQLLLGS